MAGGQTRPGKPSIDGSRHPLGDEQVTGLSAAKHLTPPAGATFAIIQAESQNVRWRDSGSAPTASVGTRMTPDSIFFYSGDLDAIQFIEEAASAKLNVSYYG